MEEVTALDPRLAALLPVIEELKALRAYLLRVRAELALQQPPAHAPESGEPEFWRLIKWIDETIERILPHLHTRRWPPVWWRIGGMNIDAVLRNIHRADADGCFLATPGSGQTYLAQREAILERVDRVGRAYKVARGIGRG